MIRRGKGPRFFLQSSPKGEDSANTFNTGEIPLLSSADSHHALHVLRLEEGDSVVAIHAKTQAAFQGELRLMNGLAGIYLQELLGSNPPLTATDTLIFALSKGKRNDLVCEKATELGVRHIIFWESTRSVVRVTSQKDKTSKLDRWQRISESACKQCHRVSMPELSLVSSSTEALSLLSPHTQKLCCSLSREAKHISTLQPMLIGNSVDAVIGPEGDLTPEEEREFVRASFHLVSLGVNILRSETAALCAISMIEALAQPAEQPTQQ